MTTPINWTWNDDLQFHKDLLGRYTRPSSKYPSGYATYEAQKISDIRQAVTGALVLLARLSAVDGFAANAIVGYKVPTEKYPHGFPRVAPPIFNDCKNCGSVDHRNYDCPCKCHARGVTVTPRF